MAMAKPISAIAALFKYNIWPWTPATYTAATVQTYTSEYNVGNKAYKSYTKLSIPNIIDKYILWHNTL